MILWLLSCALPTGTPAHDAVPVSLEPAHAPERPAQPAPEAPQPWPDVALFRAVVELCEAHGPWEGFGCALSEDRRVRVAEAEEGCPEGWAGPFAADGEPTRCFDVPVRDGVRCRQSPRKAQDLVGLVCSDRARLTTAVWEFDRAGTLVGTIGERRPQDDRTTMCSWDPASGALHWERWFHGTFPRGLELRFVDGALRDASCTVGSVGPDDPRLVYRWKMDWRADGSARSLTWFDSEGRQGPRTQAWRPDGTSYWLCSAGDPADPSRRSVAACGADGDAPPLPQMMP